jgi:hypothetical protein
VKNQKKKKLGEEIMVNERTLEEIVRTEDVKNVEENRGGENY